MTSELKTYGDLKKLLKYVKLAQKGGKILSQGKEFVIDQILGVIPGASNAKTAFDFFKATFSKPDTVKTDTWLDKLDIDDKVSKIVDDTVEDGFLQNLVKSLEGVDDNKELEPDFNINVNLQNYLKKNYDNRSVSLKGENISEKGNIIDIYNKNTDMSKLNKIVKEGVNRLLENFEDMEVAFGTKEIKNLSDAEKNQFGPMGQLKTNNGGSFKNPTTNGMKEVDKANKVGGTDAKAYYKEVAKKIKDYQTPNDKEKFDTPKVPTNAKGENERIKTTGYDVGISGMEVVADLASEEGGSDAVKKQYKDRITNLNKGDKTYDKMAKNAKETNILKYKKEANNTRPVKQQKSPQPVSEGEVKPGADVNKIMMAFKKFVADKYPQLIQKIDQPVERAQVIAAFAKNFGIEANQLGRVKSIIDSATKSEQPQDNHNQNQEKMGENIKYEGVDSKNIFKANGKLVSEEQVIKLANKVPSRVKIDESVFAITDGKNTYKILWEGDSKSGEPVITNVKNTELVKEDIQEMKRLWNFKTSDAISTKKNVTESGEDAFKRMYKLIKEDKTLEEENILTENCDCDEALQSGQILQSQYDDCVEKCSQSPQS